ncbi:DUF2268 domain-containing putative Zn-dependent protease [Oceanobacillus bengalensis]|uniref:Zn-dependent protease n=1 Tax=Oceanobacillus bengalensis TaxID=1435466 RepID=A0A494YS21_9BACI|nr:DUF2268 domain-containing putative Zn-dependent protease [Oceanobacillus bengalensis]RKQ12434.1 Zn-dependent protease [Oceanobacillus bengalensis]
MKKQTYKLVVIVFFTSLLLLMGSCAENAETNSQDDTNKTEESGDTPESDRLTFSFNHPETEQTFKIIHAYKLYENYEERELNNPDENDLELYKQEVIEPIYDDCFSGSAFPYSEEEISTLAESANKFEFIQGIADKIDSEKVNRLIEDALIRSTNLLSSDTNKTVCIFPATSLIQSSMMETLGPENIIVYHDGLLNGDILQAGIAHEYQHSVMFERTFNRFAELTVLDYIIDEGKAVMFEKMLYPESNFTTVNYSYNNAYWSKVEPYLYKVDYTRASEILFGGNGLPEYYGYSEGYKIVKSFLELNPDVTVEQWTNLTAKKIYEEGRYVDNYN